MAYYDSQDYDQQQLSPPPFRRTEESYGYNTSIRSEYSYTEPYRRHSLPQGQIVRVCTKANPDYALGIRDGRVMLVYYNPSDPTQQWVKDDSWNNRVRDAVGHPAFCLVNKATGQALRHAAGPCQEVLVTKYEPGSYDEDVMWSQSEDMGYEYRTIRMAKNIGLNLDAFQGDKRHGGIMEGTPAVLWKWNKQDNQLWKIAPMLLKLY